MSLTDLREYATDRDTPGVCKNSQVATDLRVARRRAVISPECQLQEDA